jgi:hypothetical protein
MEQRLEADAVRDAHVRMLSDEVEGLAIEPRVPGQGIAEHLDVPARVPDHVGVELLPRATVCGDLSSDASRLELRDLIVSRRHTLADVDDVLLADPQRVHAV